MAESWVRLWAGTTTDPKFKTIARKSGRPLCEVIGVFAHLLLLANQSETRGALDTMVLEDVASALDLDEEVVQTILEAMQGRVIDNGTLTGWEKRQPVREDTGNETSGALSNTERSRLFREKKKGEETRGNALQRNETLCNAPEAETETDSDSETDSEVNPKTAARESPPDPTPKSLVGSPPHGSAEGDSVCKAMRPKKIAGLDPAHPLLLALLHAGATVDEFLGAAAEAVKRGKPSFAYVLGIVKRRREEAAKLVLHQGRLPNAQEALEDSNRAAVAGWKPPEQRNYA
jgi:hypothetical protein